MAEKYKVEKGPKISWADPSVSFYLKAVKASTDIKQLRAKRKVPPDAKFGEPQSIGEISADIRKKGPETLKGRTCLGIILYENSQAVLFSAPITIA